MGQAVADSVWTLRLSDGFAPPPPPFFGVQSIVDQPAAVVSVATPLVNAPVDPSSPP